MSLNESAPGTAERCRVCGTQSRRVFTQKLLGRSVDYFDCTNCGYVQTQTPDWLEEAYSSAINATDTGIIQRNQVNVGRVVMTLASFRMLRARVIDHAGGYGILVRMLRDVGVDARWSDKYCPNLLARGFEAQEQPYDLLTAFELFEHLIDPLTELRAMLRRAPVVLISTELVPTNSTPASDWWYFGPEHGQHIGFFRAATLRWMADRAGCHCASAGRSLHLFSLKPVPIAWETLVRLRRMWPLISRVRLRSRTISDFEALRQSS